MFYNQKEICYCVQNIDRVAKASMYKINIY